MTPLSKSGLLPISSEYLATKIEAFHGRGHEDFLGSQDLEDLIAVVNGRDTLLEEINRTPPVLRRYLGQEFSRFLNDHRFVDSLDGHLGFEDQEQNRKATVLKRLREIASHATVM